MMWKIAAQICVAMAQSSQNAIALLSFLGKLNQALRAPIKSTPLPPAPLREHVALMKMEKVQGKGRRLMYVK